MKSAIFFVFCLIFAFSNIAAQTMEDAKYKVKPSEDKNSPTKVYIPENLDDCFKELKKMLTPELIEEMKTNTESDMVKYHHGLGMWIRNNWGLWTSSRLKKYFNDLGIHHPDDMSGIILTSFWRSLNDKPIQLEKQIKYYQDYWNKTKKQNKNKEDVK